MPLDVKSTWNACGEAYDRFTTAADSFADNLERPVVEKLIGDVNGARVLELGCGSGPYSLWLAQRGARVTGVDLSATMIALANDRAHKQGVQVDFRVGDIREPFPFADSEFDLIITAAALHYVEDLAVLMKEVVRVLKLGGLLVASVLHPMSTALFPLADADEVEGPDPWEGWYFGSPIRRIKTPWINFAEVSAEGQHIACNHHTIADYFQAMTGAGLRVEEIREPVPPPEFASLNSERYDKAMRMPVFLIFGARIEDRRLKIEDRG